jgi:hypothetical protein
MTHAWDRLIGVSIAEKYILEEWLGGDEHAAFFVTRSGPGGDRAVLKLVREDPAKAQDQLAGWRGAAHLSHPNLLAVLDCGRAGFVAKSADASYLYAVFEYPDDNLAVALERGPMEEAETSEVLRAALDGLRYLHGRGMVHGAVDPAHVVAVGNRIKLATDTVRVAGAGATPADDARALGAMLHDLMGRRDLASISDPLRSIVRHALDPEPNRRWTLPEIAAFLDPPSGVASEPEPRRPQPHFPRWAFAAIALPLVAGAVIALAHRSAPSRPAPSAPGNTAASAGTPSGAPKPAPSDPAPAPAKVVPRDPGRVEAAPSPAPAADAPDRRAPEPAHSQTRSVWRVIAYTYAGHSAAEKKARHINEKWPALQAEVFAPQGRNRGPYLVALGGRMTRADAVRLQKTALARGLPRDTFVRNYSE